MDACVKCGSEELSEFTADHAKAVAHLIYPTLPEWLCPRGHVDQGFWLNFNQYITEDRWSSHPGDPSVGRRNEYRPKGGDALRLRVKADMVLFAGNTMWPIFECYGGVREDSLYYSTLPLPYLINTCHPHRHMARHVCVQGFGHTERPRRHSTFNIQIAKLTFR